MAKRGRPFGTWTKWPPERFEMALELIKRGYNYSQAAKAIGAKRHELTARLIQTGQYVRVREMRPPTWKPMHIAPRDGTHILAGYWYNYGTEKHPDWEWISEVIFLVKRDGIVDGYRDYEAHDVRNGEPITPWFTHWTHIPEPPK